MTHRAADRRPTDPAAPVRTRTPRLAALGAGLALAAVLTACTSTPASSPAGSTTASTSAATAGATTSAAASSAPTGSSSAAAGTGATGSTRATEPSATVGTTGASGSSAAGSTAATSEYGSSSTAPASSSALPSAATTPVPAPGGGNVDETVPSVPVTTAPSVPLTAPARFTGTVQARISKLAAITAQGRGPGEITGPALAFTIVITNSSADPIDLTGVNVTLVGTDGAPASPMTGPPAQQFTGTLAAGSRATGTYVFAIPTADRRKVSLAMSYSTEVPTVVFTGTAP